MIHRTKRHDYMQNGLVYAVSVVSLMLLVALAEPRSVNHFRIQEEHKKKEEAQQPQILFDAQAFKDVTVNAEAYVVYDIVNKRVVAGKNETQVLPLASVTKVMSALTASTMMDPQTNIKITKDAIDGGYDMGLKNNQEWRLDELLKYSLIFSSNDGIAAIAKHVGRDTFIAKMNEYGKMISPTLSFSDPAGLDIKGKLGGEGSAYDVALMMTLARKTIPSILDTTTHARANANPLQGTLRGIPNTNQDIVSINSAEGSKTGYTDKAGGNLAIITDVAVGHPVVLVVLGSTRTERFSDMEVIYKALLKSIH